MGRQNKVPLPYFELDCHMDDKVKLIQAEFGLKGFAVIVKLYQKIYGGEFGYYCEWDNERSLLFALENGLNGDGKNLINEIVAACIKRNLFSERLYKEYGILTSSGVQKQYLKATSKREVIELKKEYLLISIPENRNNVVINSISGGRNPISDGRNKQSRVEKSKEDKSKEDKSKEDKSKVEKSILNTSCTEPKKSPSVPPVISLILNDKTFYDVFESDIENWTDLYPAVDIMQELRKMKGWLDSNPAKRKTRRGISRFINSWLARTQDSGGTRNTQQSSSYVDTIKNRVNDVDNW